MKHNETQKFGFRSGRTDQAKTSASGRSSYRLLPAGCDPGLLLAVGAEFCLRNGIVPIRKSGTVTIIAKSQAVLAPQCMGRLVAAFGSIAFVNAPTAQITALIERSVAPRLAIAATTRTSARENCRNWSPGRTAGIAIVFASALIVLGATSPSVLMGFLVAWATITLLMVTGLRTAGALVQLRSAQARAHTWRSTRPNPMPKNGWPRISLLVPLFHEKEIAERLVRRLERLDYPRDKLEILLVLESDDRVTREALTAAHLPDHFRTVTVPPGHPRTKPRALNYAMDHSSGAIIGIYDAEDAPEANQLFKVATAFETADPTVGCLQGVLDFYNSKATWLTRCFTIDYATWFRLVLPGFVRLGLAIPLGGTTVFFRRDVLEKVGRWDAHNVTEDADLGIRLARRGYRTEFIESVTFEEATATVPTWIKQRSRWIKGYAITWAVHMRSPGRLLDELGPWKFLGFQIVFLGSLSQFILAPLLWSFWLVLFGFPHPVLHLAPWAVVVGLGVLFLLAEVATLTISALSVATPRHRSLIWWVPALHLYFPLAAFACWKALFELMTRPFFWDKTAHGGSFSRPPPGLSRLRLRRPA